MMNIYLIIATLLANVIAIAIVYQFIKRLDKKQKLLFIGIGFGLMYILISIIYWFSGFGIDKEVHMASKNFVLYLFVPVNVIVIVPYFAFQYMKYKTKQIKKDKFANKLTILAVVLLILVIIEFIVFKNIQKNIEDISTKTRNQVTQNLEQKNISTNEEVEHDNEVIENEEIMKDANIIID